jgi:hypothetical protein
MAKKNGRKNQERERVTPVRAKQLNQMGFLGKRIKFVYNKKEENDETAIASVRTTSSCES